MKRYLDDAISDFEGELLSIYTLRARCDAVEVGDEGQSESR